MKKIMLSELSVKRMIFQSPFNPVNWYIVSPEKVDFIEFLNRYPNSKQAEGINLEGTEKFFFLVFVSDCYDPPIYIVRADSPQDAEEWFVEETTIAIIEEPDLQDYDEDKLSINSKGQWYDPESIQVYEISLISVEL